MQPSLSAQAGCVTGPPVTFSNIVYQRIRTLAEFRMQMETAAILILRKVLNPDIPAHQVNLTPCAQGLCHFTCLLAWSRVCRVCIEVPLLLACIGALQQCALFNGLTWLQAF